MHVNASFAFKKEKYLSERVERECFTMPNITRFYDEGKWRRKN